MTFASLTPTLLARKGAAKPAMRSQYQPLGSQAVAARQLDDDHDFNDLGFNDLGDDTPAALHQAEIVELKPEVRHQQEQLQARIGKTRPMRRSALAQGRSAAFTLRLDAARHLQLRLACTLAGRSAQHLLTQALDQMIADMPEVATITEQAGSRRTNLKKGDPK